MFLHPCYLKYHYIVFVHNISHFAGKPQGPSLSFSLLLVDASGPEAVAALVPLVPAGTVCCDLVSRVPVGVDGP